MRKNRGAILIGLSLCLGGLAAWAANGWVNERLALQDEEGSIVVVAALEIPYGTKVESRHVRAVKLPEDGIPDNAFTSLDEVQGMVATTLVTRGEALLKTRFAEHLEGSTLAALVGASMRAVTVRVDDVVGVAGFLLPGNRVDVLATRYDRTNKRAQTQTILQNIKVLAVDQTAATQQSDPVIVRAVTLEMTPAQSEELVKAKEEGTIQLTLRNPLEQTVVAKAETPTPVVKKPPPMPVRQAPVRRNVDTTITVIRGTKVDKTRTKS